MSEESVPRLLLRDGEISLSAGDLMDVLDGMGWNTYPRSVGNLNKDMLMTLGAFLNCWSKVIINLNMVSVELLSLAITNTAKTSIIRRFCLCK